MAKKLSWTAVSLCIEVIPVAKMDEKAVMGIFKKIEAMAWRVPRLQFTAWQKKDASPVTSIDLHLQRQMVELIRQDFPAHRILAEEDTGHPPATTSAYTWVIDPIDGTGNLVAGKRAYASAVGLMRGNRFIAAQVVFPAIGESYLALAGMGVRGNGAPLTGPPPLKKPAEIVLCSKSYPRLGQPFKQGGYHVSCYTCATYSMLQVLKGEALLYYTVNTRIYDVGPMSYILERLGINSFAGSGQAISFEPSLDNIPFFLSLADSSRFEDVYPVVKNFL
jgi:fructose-1,6-bisphosphatase/inositol monophosphatase family enzyme